MDHTPNAIAGDVLAVHSIDEFVFSVPDIEVARHFYSSFGLDVRDEPMGLGLYTVGHPHRWARILPGTKKRLLWVTFGIHPQDEARWRQRLQGVPLLASPPGARDEGLWMRGPDGLPVQLKPASKCSPDAPAPQERWPSHANVGRAPARSKAAPVRPCYLSHVLLFTADVDEALRFYTEVLGLRLSDRSGSNIAFLHSPYGSDHHLVALARSSGAGLHHSSWCVGSVDELGIGMEQMARAGYAQGWGVGRHVLGSNYFRYVKDPWGSYVEYCYDIDYVDAGVQWQWGDHPAEDSLHLWGPDVPSDFVVNHEMNEQA